MHEDGPLSQAGAAQSMNSGCRLAWIFRDLPLPPPSAKVVALAFDKN